MSSYKNNQSNIDHVVTKLRQDISDYNLKINEIIKFTNEIRDSNDWQDEDLKPNFLKTCSSYIEIYQKIISSLTANVDFIEKHNNKIASLNQAYIRR